MFEKALIFDPSNIIPGSHRDCLKKAPVGVDANALSDELELVLVYLTSQSDLEDIEALRFSSSGMGREWVAVLSSDFEWEWSQLINDWRFSRILFLNEDTKELLKSLEEAASNFHHKMEYQRALKEFKNQNKLLEEGQEDLSQKVKERTESLSQSKREIEENLSHTRDLMRFIQDLSAAGSIEDLFNLLRREIKSFHSVGSPLLYYHLNPSKGYLLWSQSQNVISKPVRWIQPKHMRIRVNQVQDSKVLANLLSRPFSKVIAFPFSFRQSSALAEIFFEHQLEGAALDLFLKFVSERLQAFGVALDRILLDIDLRRASSQWETTFDGLDQPVVIVDLDLQVLRHNRHFTEDLLPAAEDKDKRKIWQEALKRAPEKDLQWKTEKSVFEVDLYPIQVDGGADHVICYYTDITLERELQGQVIQSEKMAALGHLAGNIAHELNNPLTGVRSLAQVLVQQVGDSSQVGADLLEVEKAAERSQKIITNLLKFAQTESQADPSQKVDLNQVVENALSLLKTLMSLHQRDIDYHSEPLWVSGDPHLLQQVIFNIVHNACQAMPEAGHLQILTGVNSGEALFCVSDSGKGIPPDIQKQIFEPFFTTKAKGEGTGLGLSMSQKLVRNMSGRIELESEVGRGTTFKVYLPLAKAPHRGES